jgi:polyhydroxyalkanoate synthesis regulator phasin
VAEVSLAKKGKLKLQSAREFLNELWGRSNTLFQKASQKTC